MTGGKRSYEDLSVGEVFDSPGRTITEADVVAFAGLSGDYNELHTDAEFMKSSRFGRRIAHGLLVLSIASGLSARAIAPPVDTIAFLSIADWRFRGPVFFGDTVRVRIKMAEKRLTRSGNAGIVRWHREIVNQHGETVQDGTIVTMVAVRGAPGA